MAIKILRKGMPVVGFAKLGETSRDPRMKGAPTKFDHFLLTGRERDADGRLCLDLPTTLALIRGGNGYDGVKTCGGCEHSKWLAQQFDAPELAKGLPVELPILLPYDDLELALPHRLAYYKGRTVFCTGDGENAERLQIVGQKGGVEEFGPPAEYGPCGEACKDFQDRRCKPAARLRFLLGLQATVGGAYEYRTTSWNSIANLVESLTMVQTVTGGSLAWIRLWLEVGPQTVQPRGGRANTAYIARVSYRGTPQQLLGDVRENLALRAGTMRELRQLEAVASRGWEMTPEEVEEFRREFDPSDDAPVVEVTLTPEPEPAAAETVSEEEAEARGRAADEAFGNAPPTEPPPDKQETVHAPAALNGKDDDPIDAAKQAEAWKLVQDVAKRTAKKDGTPILRNALNVVGKATTNQVTNRQWQQFKDAIARQAVAK